jgi:hypothetical protein
LTLSWGILAADRGPREPKGAALPGLTSAARGEGGAFKAPGGERGNTVRNDQLTPSAQAVFRSFVKDDRITAMPAKRSKRLVLLDHVAGLFEIGVYYREQDVNSILRTVIDDYVTLRRYLVDEGFLDRAEGEYWRIGGTVDMRDG